MAKYSADTIPVCLACDNSNKKDATRTCKRCGVTFCKHFMSTTDVRFCANCIGDVLLRETIMEKEISHERADGTVSFSRKYQARRITLQGIDWLFASTLIENSSDEELEATIEYHRANVDLMLMERESRKLERIKKLAGIRIPRSTAVSQHERDKQMGKDATSVLKGSKRTKTKEKDITPEAMLAAIMQLASNGSAADRAKLIAALGGASK